MHPASPSTSAPAPTVSETWPAGSLRYRREDGSEVICAPHESAYSTITMLAQEWWDPSSGRWRDISCED